MKTVWFKQCKTEDEKLRLRERLLTNNDLFDILRSVLKGDMERNLKELEDRDNITWNSDAGNVALHLAAERKTLRRLLEILDFKE
jgi:hypothetical protein